MPTAKLLQNSTPVSRFKFTDLALKTLPYSEHTLYVWDTASPIGLRIGKRTKVFVRIKQGGTRETLGRFPFLSLTQARQNAFQALQARYLTPGHNEAPRAAHAVEEYLKTHAAKTRQNTQRDVKRIFARHLLPQYKDSNLALITTQNLTQLLDGLLKTPSEAIKTHSVLSAFFSWAQKRTYIPANPLARISPPARPKHRDRVLTDLELAKVIRYGFRNAHTQYGMLLLILIKTGLRKMEAASLNWKQITPEYLTIPAAVAKNRTELILPNTINVLFNHIKKQHYYEKLFPKPIDWTREKKKVDAETGVHDWVLHDLRRTFATKMAEWEICTPDVTEAILNHKSGGTRSPIARVYDRHNRLPQMRRAMMDYSKRLGALDDLLPQP